MKDSHLVLLAKGEEFLGISQGLKLTHCQTDQVRIDARIFSLSRPILTSCVRTELVVLGRISNLLLLYFNIAQLVVGILQIDRLSNRLASKHVSLLDC